MPEFRVTIDTTSGPKIVIVNTDDMEATMASSVSTPGQVNSVDSNQVHLDVGHGGKRSAPSFRLKKRRITRKLKKTR